MLEALDVLSNGVSTQNDQTARTGLVVLGLALNSMSGLLDSCDLTEAAEDLEHLAFLCSEVNPNMRKNRIILSGTDSLPLRRNETFSHFSERDLWRTT